jgi:hypothetical protein
MLEKYQIRCQQRKKRVRWIEHVTCAISVKLLFFARDFNLRLIHLSITMSKPSVLIAGCVHFALKELEALSKQHQVYHLPQVSRPEFFELCKSKYQGVKTVYRESTSAKYIGRFDEELINHLPQR